MNAATFEAKFHEILARHFRYSVLPNVRLFRPSYVEKRRYGFEMDNLLHIAFEGSDYIIVIETKNQVVTEVKGEWQVTYDDGFKCARKQVQEHVATLREYLEPLSRGVDLRFLGIVVSADERTVSRSMKTDETEEYYCRFHEHLPELLSERFNLRRMPNRGFPEVMRLSQSSYLELFRLGVPLEFLGHPEISSAVRYVERCRRSIDGTIFQHFSPSAERWAINGSAGMGKSVLLGYAACVLASGYQLEHRNGQSVILPATERLRGMKFDPSKGSLGVFSMSQRQLDNLRSWFEHFSAIFRSLDTEDKVRFRRPEFHLCRTMAELEQRPWSAVLLDEAHDLEENVAKRLVYRHLKDGFYLMLACDRHQKLRLAGEDVRIIEGLDFSSHTRRLRQIYRNPSSVYIASLALMFRWFAESGPKILPTRDEMVGGFGFEIEGSMEEGYTATILNDAHPANAWSHTVGGFPSATAAFGYLSRSKLGRKEVLWVRFSGEDRDFDYECLHEFTYHNFRTEEAESLTDKYIKGQDFPIVVIEGFPSFMDRHTAEGVSVDEAAAIEKRMWKFRRELYLCASRATCFLYLICTNTGTRESENIRQEIGRLTKALGTPENIDDQRSKRWKLKIASVPPDQRRKLTVFGDSPLERTGAANLQPPPVEPALELGEPISSQPAAAAGLERQETPRPVYVISGTATVGEMAARLEVKVFRVVKQLIELTVFAKSDTMISEEYQRIVAEHFGFDIRVGENAAEHVAEDDAEGQSS